MESAVRRDSCQASEHERPAEGMTVSITKPWPRRVVITKAGRPGGVCFQGLTIKEAEGLRYALNAVLADVDQDDK